MSSATKIEELQRELEVLRAFVNKVAQDPDVSASSPNIYDLMHEARKLRDSVKPVTG